MTLTRLKSLAWDFLCAVILLVTYWHLQAEGFRLIIPALAVRLYRLPIPGFSYLADYEATYRCDLALGMAVLLLVATWTMWGILIRDWLGIKMHSHAAVGNPGAEQALVRLLAYTILGCDFILFYRAATQFSWGGGAFSFWALVATVCYVAILVFVKYISVIFASACKECS